MDSNSYKQSTNYLYATPISVSEDNVNDIRKKVLEKSNYYRNKYDIESLILDEQVNNVFLIFFFFWLSTICYNRVYEPLEDVR